MDLKKLRQDYIKTTLSVMMAVDPLKREFFINKLLDTKEMVDQKILIRWTASEPISEPKWKIP